MRARSFRGLRNGLGLGMALVVGLLVACGDDDIDGGGPSTNGPDASVDGRVNGGDGGGPGVDGGGGGGGQDSGNNGGQDSGGTDAGTDAGQDSGGQATGDGGVDETDPTGTALAWSQVIGAAGGTFDIPGVAKLIVPAGALAANTTLTAKQVGLPAVPGRDWLGPQLQFGPTGTTFSTPATIELTIKGTIPTSAVVMTGDDDVAPSTALTTTIGTGKISAPVAHFSPLAAAYLRPIDAPPASNCTVVAPQEVFTQFGTTSRPSQNVFPLAAANGAFVVGSGDLRNINGDFFIEQRTAAGALVGTANGFGLFGNVAGGSLVRLADDGLVAAYENNLEGGSAVWLQRASSAGAVTTTKQRMPASVMSNPTLQTTVGAYSEMPVVVRTNAGVLAFWSASPFSNPGGRCVRGALANAASLALQRGFRATPCEVGVGVETYGTPAAAASSDGNYVMVTYEHVFPLLNGGTHRIEGVVLDAFGKRLTEPTIISPAFTNTAQMYHSVAPTTDGDFVVAWSSDTNTVLHLRAVSATTGLAGREATYDGVNGSRVSVASDGNGFAIAYAPVNGIAVLRTTSDLGLKTTPITLFAGPGSYGYASNDRADLAVSGTSYAVGFSYTSGPEQAWPQGATNGRVAFATCSQ